MLQAQVAGGSPCKLRGSHVHELDNGRAFFCEGSRDKDPGHRAGAPRVLPTVELPPSAFRDGRPPRFAPLLAAGTCGPALSAVIAAICRPEPGAVSNMREAGARRTRVVVGTTMVKKVRP